MLSSGGDQIFPKGLPVGTVAQGAVRGKELFLNIKVKPAADLSRLEEVLVVIEKQDQRSRLRKRGTACARPIFWRNVCRRCPISLRMP